MESNEYVMLHTPVLLREVLEIFNPTSDQHFIDATIGEGGHARAILEKTAPGGMILGVDRDIQQIERAKKGLSKFGKRIVLINDSFGNVEEIVKDDPSLGALLWQGILFDLGWSQAQMEMSERGFGITKDEPLDMRYETKSKNIPAMDIVNKWSGEDIERALREYGEERFARAISEEIVRTRRGNVIQKTFQLVDVIKRATPLWYHRRRIHPATKTFQALRIAVNNEYEEIEKGVSAAPLVLARGGIIVVISFHSGEDRIVKNLFKGFSQSGKGVILTKKPIRPSEEEVHGNPRARSAKLRAFKVK